jgi:hypothetical protein
MTLTLPKWGLGSPLGLPKFQSLIAGVKTSRLEAFFISLEIYWNVDVENGLAWALDICNTSYGKKKGRESNWQFDSRPLKVGNRLDPGVCRWSATYRWKALKESYKFFFKPRPNWRSKQRVMNSQSPGSLNWDSFMTPPQESQDKKSLGCGCHGVTQRILYGGRWWLPPSPGRGESYESRVARGLS